PRQLEEQWQQKHWSEVGQADDEQQVEDSRDEPPPLRYLQEEPENDLDRKQTKQQTDHVALQPIGEPAAERLHRQPILPREPPASDDGEGKGQNGVANEKGEEVRRDLTGSLEGYHRERPGEQGRAAAGDESNKLRDA